jgi:hypothetical protein
VLSAAIIEIQGCHDQENDLPIHFDGSFPDSSTDDGSEPTGDAGDGGQDAGPCPSSWLVAPTVDSTLVPDGGAGTLALHAAATGTQDYACLQATDGGAGFGWTFTGPEADLQDCHGILVGKHFAAGMDAGAPEWMTTADSSFVIGKKLASETPDGGANAIPWLLLQAVDHGGTGTLSKVQYVQRVNTTGGLVPTATCAASNSGASQKVVYTADYYFYTP